MTKVVEDVKKERSGMNKLSNFIAKLGDFFSIMCPKCDEDGIGTRMDRNYYMSGAPDSIYWTCKKCGHKEDLPDAD